MFAFRMLVMFIASPGTASYCLPLFVSDLNECMKLDMCTPEELLIKLLWKRWRHLTWNFPRFYLELPRMRIIRGLARTKFDQSSLNSLKLARVVTYRTRARLLDQSDSLIMLFIGKLAAKSVGHFCNRESSVEKTRYRVATHSVAVQEASDLQLFVMTLLWEQETPQGMQCSAECRGIYNSWPYTKERLLRSCTWKDTVPFDPFFFLKKTSLHRTTYIATTIYGCFHPFFELLGPWCTWYECG